MKRRFLKAHLVVASLILVGIVAQPFLIGLFLFGAVHSSDLHTAVGYSLFEFGLPLLLITALLARLPKTERSFTLLLIGDLFVQILLVNMRDVSAVLAALHPLNAFALLLIAITVVKRDRILLRESETSTDATG
jgi:hypothetical protein